MNLKHRPDSMDVGAQIDLAHEQDFSLGLLEVHPSLRQAGPAGRQETVEPRVMQVLVALVRAHGKVVSRDALIESCWGGRIVGEDAINRCVAKVRQLLERAGDQAPEIETIPRVGYRLLQPSLPLALASSLGSQEAETFESVAVPLRPAAQWPRWKRIATGAAACLVAALMIAGGLRSFWPAPPTHWVVDRMEMPIASSLIERHPAISPDGSTIAYSAGTDIRGRKIYLIPTSGGERLRLTDDTYDDVSPAWSPDGKEIIYVAHKDGEPCHLMEISVPPGSPRELGRCQTDERSHVTWSASGNELFFLDRPNTRSVDRIMRFDLATGRRTQLTDPPPTGSGDQEPAVSPDGRWIVFHRHQSDLVDRRILRDLRSGAEHVLINHENGDDIAAWSDDSKTVFVTSEFAGEFALWAYPIDGGSPSRVLSSPQAMGRLSAGPGGLLAVETFTCIVNLARSPIGKGVPALLDPEKGCVLTPDIAQDGTIAVYAARPGGGGIWLKPKGGPMRKLIGLQPEEAGEYALWSPDGSRIAFETYSGNAIHIRIVTRAGADMTTIAVPGTSIGMFTWSSDGSAVIFPSQDTGGWRLWRAELAHPDSPKPLPYRGWLSVRMRNNELYGVRYDVPGVWRIDGTPRRIAPLPGPERSDDWTIAGDEIAYVDEVFGKHRQVLAQPIRGGPARVMAQVPNYNWRQGFAIDPIDGAIVYIAIGGGDIDTDIALLHLATR
jgi:Tol biopolymer transport system component/DNA-binding winged helix-turn-helix (wHTH) protein